MSFKTFAFLAFLGMLVLTVLVIADLVRDIYGVLRDVVPTVRLVRSLVYAFASVTAAAFLFVFYRRQS